MTRIRAKQPRVKLERSAYEQLRLQVLERDHYQCQHCGSRKNLQVHHLEFRSRSGGDGEENLITLCEECHRSLHS